MLGLGELAVLVVGGVLLLAGGRLPMLWAMVRRQVESRAEAEVRRAVDRVLQPGDGEDEDEDPASAPSAPRP